MDDPVLEPLFCASCANEDPHFAASVLNTGAMAKCSKCGETRRVVSLEQIADLVHAVFKRHAVRADDTFDFSGENPIPMDGGVAPLETLESELKFPIEIAEPVLATLARRHGRDQRRDPGDDWYDESSEATVLRPAYSTSAIDEWAIFLEQICHHGRFFNDEARRYLDELFGPLLRGDLHEGTPPIVTLGAYDSVIKHVYRGRPAETEAEQRIIFSNPQRELGPPPPKLRRANRMNAEGVPAFYGALDIDTCVAELRPAVHGRVVVGKFRFFQPARVLDLRLVDNAVPKLSWFDPDFSEKYAAGRFIRELHDIMRLTVLPGAPPLDYLPTQVIAEYLASSGLDGVLYVSALVDRPKPEEEDGYIHLRPVDDDGVNLVLFWRSCIVVGGWDHDIVDLDEPVRFGGNPGSHHVVRRKRPTGDPADIDYPLVEDALLPTLELVENEIVVSEVLSIKHDIVNHRVAFVTEEEAERELRLRPF